MVILQDLFSQPILECVDLDPGIDENHGSLVFRVRTSNEDVVARSFRLGELAGPFWGNLNKLFGINPLNTTEVAAIYSRLQLISPIPVPQVIKVGQVEDREWIVVELMAGHPIADFAELSDQGLIEFGRNLGKIHSQKFAWFGSPSSSISFAPSAFAECLVNIFQTSLDCYPDDPDLSAWIDPMCAAAVQMPVPEYGVLIMPDISPYQFLQDKDKLVATIDIDSYVIGPRELDFICLEYWLNQRSSYLLKQGYRQVLPLPQLSPVRDVYRYLCRLLTIRNDTDYLERWMIWSEFFP